ncbi:hypothetical protein INR49_031184 [Caranx melampygus]|nr:hypothetical protein INR49_031184 [Caranx melampygus]
MDSPNQSRSPSPEQRKTVDLQRTSPVQQQKGPTGRLGREKSQRWAIPSGQPCRPQCLQEPRLQQLRRRQQQQ